MIGPAALYNVTTLTSMRYQAHPPSGLSLYATWLFLETNFREFYKGEVRRIPIPRTPVNKDSPPPVGYMELLVGSILLGEKGDVQR